VHLLALVGSLAGFVDLKSDVARCPKHVLSDLGLETLLAIHVLDSFLLEILIHDYSTMRCSIVIHQYEIIANCT
jgi:hypothetical protein